MSTAELGLKPQLYLNFMFFPSLLCCPLLELHDNATIINNNNIAYQTPICCVSGIVLRVLNALFYLLHQTCEEEIISTLQITETWKN